MAKEQTASISRIAELMRDLDLGMLITRSNDGGITARPMSNNGEVEFDGDVWFFSGADTRKISEIEADSRVQLSYADIERYRFMWMSGTAEIVRDAKKKRELWIDDLERWFKNGPNDDDVVLIKVRPSVVSYWDGEEAGEVVLD